MNKPISFLSRALVATSGLLFFTLFDFSVAQRFTNHLGMVSVHMPADLALLAFVQVPLIHLALGLRRNKVCVSEVNATIVISALVGAVLVAPQMIELSSKGPTDPQLKGQWLYLYLVLIINVLQILNAVVLSSRWIAPKGAESTPTLSLKTVSTTSTSPKNPLLPQSTLSFLGNSEQ